MSIVKEFVEKLIGRLEEYKYTHLTERDYELSLHCTEIDCENGMECTFCVIDKAKEIVNKLAEEYKQDLNKNKQDLNKNKQGWIPCSERLPEDGDNRFYMCIVENHEEDVPMFCQYCEDHGFGFWHDFYDEHTLGFLDSEFKTNEELGYEKVIAWQPLPEPYKPEQQKEIPTKHYEERFNRVV